MVLSHVYPKEKKGTQYSIYFCLNLNSSSKIGCFLSNRDRRGRSKDSKVTPIPRDQRISLHSLRKKSGENRSKKKERRFFFIPTELGCWSKRETKG